MTEYSDIACIPHHLSHINPTLLINPCIYPVSLTLGLKLQYCARVYDIVILSILGITSYLGRKFKN
ncbi:hypothetical protein BpHYR1_021976 [Brachionus plicatilis]|uniref:Uncharacterized protein n=1 Tax=Brachionus plicatilis TaxID=10195 RepID=A0A3M7QNQ2_BRAPC|nr:hypothetical protein BpHYR1_021976 [Brachionus plicatilis]